MSEIHPTAIVSDDAVLGPGVQIGAYAIVRGRVVLGEGVRIEAHAHVTGPAEIGAGTSIGPFAVIGGTAQSRDVPEGDTRAGVVIGVKCRIREHTSVHASMDPDVPTRLGDRVFMMGTSHVGHDCQIGSDVIIVNGSLIAGHAEIADGVNLSANALVHQFSRIGRLAMLSGATQLTRDLPPFCMLGIGRNRVTNINVVGLRRAGIERDEISALRRVFREVLHRGMPRRETVEALRASAPSSPCVEEMAAFIETGTRPFCTGERTVAEAARDPQPMAGES